MGVIMEVNKGHREIIADRLRRSLGRFPQRFDSLVGIDEAGRGPLAGPVAVGTVKISKTSFDALKKFLKDYPVGKDSKKMKEKERAFWYEKILEARKKKLLDFKVGFSSNLVIDKRGIVKAISLALEKNLNSLSLMGEKVLVKLDGGLKAPEKFTYQETIVKGDEKEFVISLASVVAKVERDKLMRKLSLKYPSYSLEVHKGYGTLKHRQALKKHGLSKLHRRSFCRFYLQNSHKVLQ